MLFGVNINIPNVLSGTFTIKINNYRENLFLKFDIEKYTIPVQI